MQEIFPNVSVLEETASLGSGMKSKIGCGKGSMVSVASAFKVPR
jgi:hypothetical protein